MKARLASANANKLRELRHALPGWTIELLDAGPLPPEDGATYEENARAKARFARRFAAAEEWALGEDSGIEVDALGGRPGVETARWARGREVDAVLEALGEADDRGARYVSVVVALDPRGEELVARGTLEGSIARTPAGGGGFGFDPVFVPHGEERRVAELGDAWKVEHSHRGAAARELAALVASVRG